MVGGVMLLERAMSYTLGSLLLATDTVLARPTPCSQWDVHRLLIHMGDSLAVLCDAADVRWTDPDPEAHGSVAAGLVATIRARSCPLLGAWAGAQRPSLVSVGGRPLPSTIIAGAGAIEVAVHGWDLAVGCGRQRPMPPSLAEELLDLAMLMVTEADRPGRFASPVPVPRAATSTDRLVAYLGRDPARAGGESS